MKALTFIHMERGQVFAVIEQFDDVVGRLGRSDAAGGIAKFTDPAGNAVAVVPDAVVAVVEAKS